MKKIYFKFLIVALLSLPLSVCYSQKKSKTAFSTEKDTEMVKAILKNIDQNVMDTSIYSDDIVHMGQGNRAITNKADLRKLLEAESMWGHSEMKHELISLQSYPDIVLTRGQVKGTYYPNDGSPTSQFETNNVIIFKRMNDGGLKVKEVIFNRINLENYPGQPNPFEKFKGEWTLKDNNWSQNWGNGTENIKITNHHTVCRELNTRNSLLAVIDGTPPYGHIFWSYNPVKKEVDHLSSFGTARAGVGKGTVNENGDVFLKISFADEAEGTYRRYSYKWISDDEYELMSVQYDANDKPTGLFYGGTFVRVGKRR